MAKRNLMGEAIEQALMLAPKIAKEIKPVVNPTDVQMLNAYVRLHRGNPAAMAQFVSQHAPAGSNPLAQMRRYENDMERRLAAKGWPGAITSGD
jgi:hypothetical protein